MSNSKPMVGFRLDPESLGWLDEYVKRTGKPRSDVFKEALTLFRKERDSETKRN